jgi:hypothetical protein
VLEVDSGFTHDASYRVTRPGDRQPRRRKGLAFASEADSAGSGPGSFMLIDPDGNPSLVDQHV